MAASHHAGLVLLQLSRCGMLRTVDRAHIRALEERVLQGLHDVRATRAFFLRRRKSTGPERSAFRRRSETTPLLTSCGPIL